MAENHHGIISLKKQMQMFIECIHEMVYRIINSLNILIDHQ